MKTKRECSCDPDIILKHGYATGYNTVVIDAPTGLFETRTSASIDSCLAEEIKLLWGKGIRTTGCCCGHNLSAPFINVDDRDVDKMLAMGYRFYYFGGLQHDRRDTFYPKTLCD